MNFKTLSCVFIMLGAAVAHRASAQLPAPPDSSQELQVSSLLAQANDLALNQFDTRKALQLYSEALSLESRNSEILWRISRSYVDIGEHMSSATDADKERQLATYEKALEFAERSVTANPENSMALTQRAIARSRVALFKGFWESVGLMKDIRDDLQRALTLDSTNHVAHFALACTHMKVIEKPWILRWPLGLGWGDRETAIQHFEEAVNLRWDHIGYRLECARAYVDEGEYELARAHLTLIPMLRTQDRDDAAARNEANVLLERIRDEE